MAAPELVGAAARRSVRPSPSTPTACPAGDMPRGVERGPQPSWCRGRTPGPRAACVTWPSAGTSRRVRADSFISLYPADRRPLPPPVTRNHVAGLRRLRRRRGRPRRGSTAGLSPSARSDQSNQSPPDPRGSNPTPSWPPVVGRLCQHLAASSPPTSPAGNTARPGRQPRYRFLDVVGHHDDRLAQPALQRQQLGLQGGPDHRVDRADGSSISSTGGSAARARATPTLLLAAGNCAGTPGELRVQPDLGQQFWGGGAGVGRGPAVETGRCDVVLHGAVRDKSGLLDDVADAAAS